MNRHIRLECLGVIGISQMKRPQRLDARMRPEHSYQEEEGDCGHGSSTGSPEKAIAEVISCDA